MTSTLLAIFAAMVLASIAAFMLPAWASIGIALGAVALAAAGGGALLAKAAVGGAILGVGWYYVRHRLRRGAAPSQGVTLQTEARPRPQQAQPVKRVEERRAA